MCNYIFSKYLAVTAFLADLLHRDEGASALEYAMLAVMVAIPLSLLIPTVDAAVTALFNAIVTALTLT